MGAWARFFVVLALCTLLAAQTHAAAGDSGGKAPVAAGPGANAAVSGGGESATVTTTMLDLKKYTDRIPNGNRLFDMQAATQKTTKTESSGAATMKNSTTSADMTSSGSTTTAPTGAFAKAFQAAGLQWTRALCEVDSDGDGQTNGQELGDPCCSWTLTGNLAYISGTSNPSDPKSRANPQMFANIVCTRTKTAKIQEVNRLKSSKATGNTNANATVSVTKKSSGSESKTKTNSKTRSSKNATRVDKSLGTKDNANSTSPGATLLDSAAGRNGQNSFGMLMMTLSVVLLALCQL